MSWLSQLKNHVRSLSTLTVAALLWAVPQTAVRAAGYVYQQHTVNAGVLIVGSAGDSPANAPDPNPYVFYVLNNRPDARPIDLTLINPQAPPTVTQTILNRWPTYTLGTAITPAMAAYWEVPLHDLSSDELQQYDVLYLPVGESNFSPADNEKLRRFVDSGGQLFVEYKGAFTTPGLFTGVTLATGTVSALSPPSTPVSNPIALSRHPLLSQPYLLSPTEINTLGDPTVTANLSNVVGSDYVNLFSPVLVHAAVVPPALPPGNAPAAVIAAQYGAGQVIASILNIGGVISGGGGATFTASTAPASDLKFLSNLISWSETHPNEFKTSHGNASATGLSAFSASWLYASTPAGANPPPAATVWGNFVFAMDGNGTLHSFDAYPAENLLGGATNDDGNIVDFGAATPTTYDEIWQNTVGANASAATIASYKGTTIAFVEKPDGSIVSFDAITGGASGLTFTKPANANGFTDASYPAGGLINAPSPTYYDGRLYAGQANGTLTIYDLNEVNGVNIPLSQTSTSGETVVGPPTVGILPNNDTNVITAIVPTNQNIYTVLLGARNEPLIQYNPGNVLTGYSIDRQRRYGLPNLVVDTNAAVVPLPVPYYSNGTVLTGVPAVTPTAPTPQDPLFAITDNSSFFTDWDTDFTQTVQSNATTFANLSYISANSITGMNQGSPLVAKFSTPAMDRRGDYYYTLNVTSNGTDFSYLIGVKSALLPSGVQLKFRFLMPATAVTNLDGVNYNDLIGYKFAGSPVVDDQGNVYVAATNGSNATVLCFQGNQGASATVSGIDLSTATLQQTDEISGQVNTLAASSGATTYGQYTASTNASTGASQVTFYNFGKTAASPQIAGNLTEPQPVQAVPNDNGTGTASATTLYLHTNLSWYVTPFACGTVTGLSKVGNSLFLTDGAALYSLPAAPTVGTGKVATAAPSKTSLNLGAVGAPPSIGGSVMVINGETGIGALTRQVTVVADNHRVLGVDSNGAAIWAVDATTNGTSKVPFSHPVSLSQFADNEFLVADTGNNRCVRFDPGGNVQWELTRFSDPNGLMAPGQPDTLSQPTSVQPHIVTIPLTAAVNPGGTVNYYLIADSGNDRIVEVADTLDASGNIVVVNGVPQSHILTWVTHTADQYGRRYRYGSATYFQPPPTQASPNPPLSIAATVTNTRIGALTATGSLGPASGDAPGGCLVIFDRPANPVAFTANPANDLIYVTPGFFDAAGNAVTVRNPRFLQIYSSPTNTSPVTGVSPFSFLYADDNGAFDLSYDTVNKKAFVVNMGALQMLNDLSATPAAGSYQAMTTSVIGDTGATYSRVGLPFAPTCVQRIDTDPNNPRYLITQSFSQGELGTIVTGTQNKIGGEIFEIDGSGLVPANQVGGFGNNSTLSHPALTGPLTQPTFAVRLP